MEGCLRNAEDQSGADGEHSRRGKRDGAVEVSTVDRIDGTIADLEGTKIDVFGQSVVETAEETVLEASELNRAGGGFRGAGSDGELEIWLEGFGDRFGDETGSYEEAVQASVVAGDDCIAYINARVVPMSMIEVHVATEVGAPERSRSYVVAEKGECACVRLRIGNVVGYWIDVKSDVPGSDSGGAGIRSADWRRIVLGMGGKGRKSQRET